MPLFPDIHGQFDIEAEQDIRHQWRLTNAVEQPDIGQGNKGAPATGPGPRVIQRLLTQSLYDSWSGPGGGRSFIALANVGLFYGISQPPLVPDVLLSLDVELPVDIWEKRHRSYMIWEYGKPPEVVIELVSNKIGGEADVKLRTYARMGVSYYVLYDPTKQLSDQVLRVYVLHPGNSAELQNVWLSGVELGLLLWQGKFEDREDTWLRWCDREGQMLLTG